jgi:hypothetical protein
MPSPYCGLGIVVTGQGAAAIGPYELPDPPGLVAIDLGQGGEQRGVNLQVHVEEGADQSVVEETGEGLSHRDVDTSGEVADDQIEEATGGGWRQAEDHHVRLPAQCLEPEGVRVGRSGFGLLHRGDGFDTPAVGVQHPVDLLPMLHRFVVQTHPPSVASRGLNHCCGGR